MNMLKCPTCGGYGKTMSTRNLEEGVMRYHKCEKCNEKFTSMQQITGQYSELPKEIIPTADGITNLFNNKRFIFEIKELFDRFDLSSYAFYCESSKDDFIHNTVVVQTAEFTDRVYKERNKFIINLSILDNELEGVIKLVTISNTGYYTKAVIGTLSYYLGNSKYDPERWRIYLDRETINKVQRL